LYEFWVKPNEMKKTLLLLPLFLSLSQISYGQINNSKSVSGQENKIEVKGNVTSDKRVRVAYATVRLMKDTIVLAVADCDSLGHFELNSNKLADQGLYLRAFYLKSYSEPYAISSGQLVYNMIIDRGPNFLKEVTIVADKPLFVREADRYIFTPGKDLTEGSSALDIVRHTPLLNYDEKSEDFSIINKSGTIVYINNKKTIMPKEMLLAILRSLPASDIKNIEIITNPGSEYAANTTGGVININIKRQPNEGFLGNLSLTSVQSKYNTTILNGAVNYRKGKLGLQFIPFINKSFNYYTQNNLYGFTRGQQENININYLRHYLVLGGGLNVDYDINTKNFVGLKLWASGVTGNANTVSNTSYSQLGRSNADSTAQSPSAKKDVYTYIFGNLNYHYQLDNSGNSYLDFNTDFNHFYQDQRITGNFNKTLNGNQTNQSAYKNDLPQQFNNLSEKIEFSRSLNKSLKLIIGAQYSNTQVHNNLHYFNTDNDALIADSSLSKNYSYSEKYWAGFITFRKAFSAKWNAAFGLRLEETNYSTQVSNEYSSQSPNIQKDSIYKNLFPNLSVSFSPNANNQLAFSINRKINRPGIELLFPGRTYQNPNYFKENNPFLQPSLYYTGELDYTFHSQYSAQLSYTIVDNSYASFIIPAIDNNTDQLKQTYLNYGTVKYLQFLLNANQKFFGDLWEVNLSPYINYNLYIGNGKPITSEVKNLNFNLLWNNTIFLSKKNKWTAFLTFKYNGPVKNISGNQLNSTSSLDLEFKKVINRFSLYLIATDLYNGSSVVRNNQYANILLSQNYSVTNFYNRSLLLKVSYSFGNNKLKGNKNRKTANEDIKNRAGQ
jgi:iron complex outermembrane receptor protein